MFPKQFNAMVIGYVAIHGLLAVISLHGDIRSEVTLKVQGDVIAFVSDSPGQVIGVNLKYRKPGKHPKCENNWGRTLTHSDM